MERFPQVPTGAGFETAIDLGYLGPGSVRFLEVNVGGVGQKNSVFYQFRIGEGAEIAFDNIQVDRYSTATSYFSILGENRLEIPIDEETQLVVPNEGTELPAGTYYIVVGGSQFKLPSRVSFFLEIGGGEPIWPPQSQLEATGRSSITWQSRSTEVWVDGDLEISLDGQEWVTTAAHPLSVRPGVTLYLRTNPLVGLTKDLGDTITGTIYSVRDNKSNSYSFLADPVPGLVAGVFLPVTYTKLDGIGESPSFLPIAGVNVPANIWVQSYDTSTDGVNWTPVSGAIGDDVQFRVGDGEWRGIGLITAPSLPVFVELNDVIRLRLRQQSDFDEFTRVRIRVGRTTGDSVLYTFSSKTEPDAEVAIGSMIYWVNPATIPARWLVMNGQSFNPVTYPGLLNVFPSGILPNLLGRHCLWESIEWIGLPRESRGGIPSVQILDPQATVGESQVVVSSAGTYVSAGDGNHSHAFTTSSVSSSTFAATGLGHNTDEGGGNSIGGSGPDEHVTAPDPLTGAEWGELNFVGSQTHQHSAGLVSLQSVPNHTHLVSVSAVVDHNHGQTASVINTIGVDNGAETVLRSYGLIPLVYGGRP